MKAALYARVSTLGQGEEDKASIPEQIARIEKYCQEKGYSVADRYVDIGYSGAKKNRPEFQRMLADAKSSKFDVIACWKADRLSRGMYPAAALMEVIEPLDISLEAVEEHLDMNYFAMLAVVGKMELDNMKARSRMGKEAKAKKGLTLGSHPYGYTYNKETALLEINEEEASVVRWIFDLYLKGSSIRQIMAKLNYLAIPTHTPSKYGWPTSRVAIILSRSAYCGEAYYNQTRGSSKRHFKPKEEWIPIPCPVIISRETFETAQDRKKKNKQFLRKTSKHTFLLKHLLYCSVCGMRFYGTTTGARFTAVLANGSRKTYYHRKEQAYYICRGMKFYHHNHNCRSPKRIWADDIEPLVWNKIDETLRQPEMLKLALENRLTQIQSDVVNEEHRLKTVKDNIDRCKREENWVITQAKKGAITEEQMDLQLRASMEDRERYDTELEEILEAKEIRAKGEDIITQAWERCQALLPRLDYLKESQTEEGIKDKQAIIQLLVDKIIVNGEGEVTINLAIPEPESVDAYCMTPSTPD